MPSWCREYISLGSQDIRTEPDQHNVVLSTRMNVYQCILFPLDSLMLVRICVGEAFDLASLASEQPVEIRTDLVALARLQSVTLSASCLNNLNDFEALHLNCATNIP